MLSARCAGGSGRCDAAGVRAALAGLPAPAERDEPPGRRGGAAARAAPRTARRGRPSRTVGARRGRAAGCAVTTGCAVAGRCRADACRAVLCLYILLLHFTLLLGQTMRTRLHHWPWRHASLFYVVGSVGDAELQQGQQRGIIKCEFGLSLHALECPLGWCYYTTHAHVLSRALLSICTSSKTRVRPRAKPAQVSQLHLARRYVLVLLGTTNVCCIHARVQRVYK